MTLLPRIQPVWGPGSRPHLGMLRPESRGSLSCSSPSSCLPKPSGATQGRSVPQETPRRSHSARSSTRHFFAEQLLSLFGHFPTRVWGLRGQARTNLARQPLRQPKPAAPRLLPEQKQLLLKGKESEERGRQLEPRRGRQDGVAGQRQPHRAHGSSWDAEPGNDPTRRAQGSTPASFAQETGTTRGRGTPRRWRWK